MQNFVSKYRMYNFTRLDALTRFSTALSRFSAALTRLGTITQTCLTTAFAQVHCPHQVRHCPYQVRHCPYCGVYTQVILARENRLVAFFRDIFLPL